jgi:choice-of-anchor B domain-containing protein
MRPFTIAFFLTFPYFLAAQNSLQFLGHLPYDTATLAGCGHYAGPDGKEYALVGTSKGMSIVDVTNPATPFQRFNVPGLSSNWREVKTWNGFAYVGSEAAGSGITIVDLHNLPDSIHWKVWYGDGVYNGMLQSSHTVQAVDGYLYVFGANSLITSGAIIADLADPWNPHIVGRYTNAYVHDGFIRGDTLWTSEISLGQFGVVDITDRTSPQLLVTHPSPAAVNHNSWLSDDSKTLFTADETVNAPLGAFDVADLSNIQLVSRYFPSAHPKLEVHNVRVLHDFLINPSYGGQLTLVDAARPGNLIETGIASLGTSLVWDADPFLPSGIILATAKSEGLFIYKPVYQRAAYLEGKVTDAITHDPVNTARVVITGGQKQDSSNAQGLYKTGTIGPGIYTVTFTKPGYTAKTITGVLLHTGELTTLDVELEPEMTGTSNDSQMRGLTVTPRLFYDRIRVQIQVAGVAHSGLLQLLNLTGQVVAEIPVSGETTVFNVSPAIPAGIYLMRATFDGAPGSIVRLVKGN